GKVEDEHWIRARVLGSAVQLLYLGGEAEFRPELLRLGESASHQGLPRDTGGKTQIVLDARTGAGLSAKGVRFQDEDREALRRSWFFGFLSTVPSEMTTIGSSPGSGAKRASNDEASASSSESITRKGVPLRSRKVASRVTSGDLRE